MGKARPHDHCLIEGCERGFYALGYCPLHWRRRKETGDPLKTKTGLTGKSAGTIPKHIGCKVENCDEKHDANGYCALHNYRANTYGDPLFVIKTWGKGKTPSARFWSRVKLTADDQRCWLWTGKPNERGYGSLQADNVRWYAHRFSYFLKHGECPDLVRHKCDTPLCVNPNHLEQGTYQDNIDDMISRGRAAWQNGRLWNPQLKKYIGGCRREGYQPIDLPEGD